MKKYRSMRVGAGALMLALTAQHRSARAGCQSPVTATPGQDVKMMLLPKFLGILPFDQANQGAQEAEAELQNPRRSRHGPDRRTTASQGQIEHADERADAGLQGRHDVEQRRRADRRDRARPRRQAGTKVVTWDSPIPTAQGETVFVAQVDFNEMGKTHG